MKVRTPIATRFSRMGAVAGKECRQILRDPSTFGIAIILPLLLMFLFGFAVSLDTEGTRIAILDEDRSALSSDLAATILHNAQFSAVQGLDRSAMQRDLVAGRVRAIIVLPVDFATNIRGKTPASVQLMTDGSAPNTATFVAAQMDALVKRWSRTQLPKVNVPAPVAVDRIRLEPHFLYNPELKSRYFLVPGAIAIVMAMIGSMLTALVVAREWERGTMEALFATPIAIGELIAAKLLPYFVLGLVSMLLCVTVAIFIYDIPFSGSFLALFCISASVL